MTRINGIGPSVIFGRSGAKSRICAGGVGLKRLYRLRSIAFVGKISAARSRVLRRALRRCNGSNSDNEDDVKKVFHELGVSFDDLQLPVVLTFQRERGEITYD